jgi:hypothetical protein
MYSLFFYVLWVIFAFLDTGPGTPLTPGPIRIRIRIQKDDYKKTCYLGRRLGEFPGSLPLIRIRTQKMTIKEHVTSGGASVSSLDPSH